MERELLSAKNLYMEYQSGEEVCIAVNHMDFEIQEGEFVTVIGASGSGKSTLLHLLAGMQNMTSGEVRYLGKNISEMTDKQKASYRGREIGFVFQDGKLLDDLTVIQNIALPGYLYEKKKSADAKAEKWLSALKISEHRNKYPKELSGGQKQRVAVARALINLPKLLFLDEPTGSLDAVNGQNLLNLLVKINEKGQSIIMVTHDMGAAARGSKVLVIKDGMICKKLSLGKYDSGKLEERKESIYRAWEESKQL